MEVRPGYKRTDVGVIPEDWDLKPLADLFTFQNGVNADKSAYGSGIAFINVLEVITNSILTDARVPGKVSLSAQARSAFAVQFGDVLFNRTSETQKEVGLASVYTGTGEVVFGGFVIRARSRTRTMNPIFTSYVLRSPAVRAQIVARGQGAIRANIGQQDLSRVLVFLPPRAEQEAIAEALGDADALIGSLEQLIAKKRHLKQGAMQELLTGRRRLPGFQLRRGYKQTEVGVVPDDWAVVRACDACSRIQDGTHFSPRAGGNDYFYVTSRNIRFGYLDISTANRIDKAQHQAIYRRCDVKKGDVLLTKDGANTGNAALNTLDDEFSLLSSVAFLRFHDSKYSAAYFLQQILTSRGQRQIKDAMAGNAITRLTLAKINNLTFPAPPTKTEQVAIATILSDMDTEIIALEGELTKSRQLKEGMMQELLTGRTRLT
jgi:type I restriction enzyme S subunit